MLERLRPRADKERQDALSYIRESRTAFEEMVARAEVAGNAQWDFVNGIRERLEAVESKISSVNIAELDDLVEEAESLARLRAYICPHAEIKNEGRHSIALMTEWGVPSTVVQKMGESLGPQLADCDYRVACGALRAIFEESDSWKSYADAYDTMMQRWTYSLCAAIAIFFLLAITLLQYAGSIVYAVFIAGAAGGCVSVITKLPPLRLSGEFEVLRRYMVSRVATGAAASMTGCALLAWGLLPISISGMTFQDVFNQCAEKSPCAALNILILLGVPVLLGFSERALMSFEERILGGAGAEKPVS